ncbi:hypothetical protein [Prochlorococcus marinus]|uniref:hypothetical protein n=1 Tax=Prochlorococcus marinus TaxID=1219 RepID=UPI0022B339E2|nr:hypothetical protein [Prochlorococcus marinus]
MDNEIEKLTGKALAEFIEHHRDEYQNNGDALCLASGYGTKSDDGLVKCNLTDFINALGKALDLDDFLP